MSDKCGTCGKVVFYAEGVNAIGQRFHKYCLKCGHCGKMLSSGDVSSHDKKPYCKQCHSGLFGTTGYGYSMTLGQASSSATNTAKPPTGGVIPPAAPPKKEKPQWAPPSAPSAHVNAPRWDAPEVEQPKKQERSFEQKLANAGGRAVPVRGHGGDTLHVEQGNGVMQRLRSATTDKLKSMKAMFGEKKDSSSPNKRPSGGVASVGGSGGRERSQTTPVKPPLNKNLPKGKITSSMATPGSMMTVQCPYQGCGTVMQLVYQTNLYDFEFQCPKCKKRFKL